MPEDILAPSLKKALEDGLKSGALVQVCASPLPCSATRHIPQPRTLRAPAAHLNPPQDKSSYKAKGFDFEEPAETRVITETLTEGSGDATVQAHDSITVNYVGRLTDGTRARPAEIHTPQRAARVPSPSAVACFSGSGHGAHLTASLTPPAPTQSASGGNCPPLSASVACVTSFGRHAHCCADSSCCGCRVRRVRRL